MGFMYLGKIEEQLPENTFPSTVGQPLAKSQPIQHKIAE